MGDHIIQRLPVELVTPQVHYKEYKVLNNSEFGIFSSLTSCIKGDPSR